mmetsp:Transcript_66067/g.183991  ORF Transcript_66067/g.183991 Transcript_66067/m.183991 type:complete len:182 (-) Transcript_66067:212-757(-)
MAPTIENGWVCAECGNTNFDDRTHCNMKKCGAPKPAPGAKLPNWICSACGNTNFGDRRVCNMRKCGAPRSSGPTMRPTDKRAGRRRLQCCRQKDPRQGWPLHEAEQFCQQDGPGGTRCERWGLDLRGVPEYELCRPRLLQHAQVWGPPAHRRLDLRSLRQHELFGPRELQHAQVRGAPHRR